MRQALRVSFLKKILAQDANQTTTQQTSKASKPPLSYFSICDKIPAAKTAYITKTIILDELFNLLDRALYEVSEGKLTLDYLFKNNILNAKFQNNKAVNLIQDCIKKFYEIFLNNIEPKALSQTQIKQKADEAKTFVSANTYYSTLLPDDLKNLKDKLIGVIVKL